MSAIRNASYLGVQSVPPFGENGESYGIWIAWYHVAQSRRYRGL